jgi:SAM-dependent methyltransferase
VDGFRAFAPDAAHVSDGFAAGYFEHLATLEVGHFWFENRNRLILWAIDRFLSAGNSFLEIGCGTGFVLSAIQARYPKLRLAGSEVLVNGLALARTRLPDVELFQMDARSMPFENEFDGIGAFDVLEHIEEDITVLKEVRKSLVPGGTLVISVPQHQFLWSAVDTHSFHKRRYEAAELRRKLVDAGFEFVFMTSFVSLLLPFMMLSRLRRVSDAPLASGEELRISSFLNAVFSAALSCERALIRAGLCFPAGGSLLAIARRPE